MIHDKSKEEQMKSLLLIALLTLCGSLYANDDHLADENVEIQKLESTIKVKIMVQEYHATFAGAS